MKASLVLISAVPLVAALMQVPAPAPPPAGDLAGLYVCEGVRPDGVAYRGLVEIVRHDQAYRVLWLLPPDEQHLGLGVVAGDVLAVSYFGALPGVVAYRIERGNGAARLIGQWTVTAAAGRVFTETLTPLERAPHAAPPRAKPERGRQPAAGLTPIELGPGRPGDSPDAGAATRTTQERRS